MNNRRLYRSHDDKIVAGVCGGIAEYFQIDSTLVRAIWLFFTVFGGSGILAYIIGIIVIPTSLEGIHGSKRKGKNTLQWGIILFIAGLVLLAENVSILHQLWNRFWGSLGNGLLAVIFLIFLIWFFGSKGRKIFQKTGGTEFSSLHLSLTDRKIAGVCGGMGEALNIDPTFIRFLWVFGTFMSGGLGILLYGVLALILPTYVSE